MSEFTSLKRKFEKLQIIDDESPKTIKKTAIQDGELYILGKKIQSINLVQSLQHIIKKPDIFSMTMNNKFNPYKYIERPLSVEREE